MLNVNATGFYTLILENTSNGCIDSALVEITEDLITPDIEAGNNVTINCFNPTLDILGMTSLADTDYEVIWSDNLGNPLSDSLLLEANSAGSYFIEITSLQNGCGPGSATAPIPVAESR